jgi:hypothetical protein
MQRFKQAGTCAKNVDVAYDGYIKEAFFVNKDVL